MEFTVTKRVENGNVSILVDGKKELNYRLSRKLTGTTNEGGSFGIFNLANEWVDFSYGNHSKSFPAMPETKYSAEDSVERIADCLRQRLLPVRAWVRSIEDSEESITVIINDDDTTTPKLSFSPAERIKSLLALGNRAKNNGMDYGTANACWALATVIWEGDTPVVSRQYEYDLNIDTYYHLAVLSCGGEELCIPVPLLSRDHAIVFATKATRIDLRNHYRDPDKYDGGKENDILSEIRSLVSAAEADAAKAVLENGDHNETLALIAGDYPNGHKPVLRAVDDE